MRTALFFLSCLVAAVGFGQVPPRQKKTLGDANSDIVSAMAVDPKGGVVVTGYSKGPDSGYDFLTIKYDSLGKLVWAKRYDGGQNEDDKPTAIAIDSKGCIYVTGSSVSHETDSDYLTIKYDPAGNLAWAKRYNGSGNGYDQPMAMAINSKDQVIVTGFSLGKGTGYDCATVEYDSNGNQLWQKSFNGKNDSDDFGNSVRVDDLGNIFVSGYSRFSKKSTGYFLVKYTADGTEEWNRTYGDKRPQDAKSTGLAVTRDHLICVTGHALGDHNASDIVTIAFDEKGNSVWQSRYDGAGHGDDKAMGICGDDKGDLIVIGSSTGSGWNQRDFVTMKLAKADGHSIWDKSYNGPTSGDDVPTAVTTDARDGSILVTGYSPSEGSGTDIVTIKYNRDGVEQWERRYDGPAMDVDRPTGIGVDIEGSIYVAGSSWGGKGSGFDFITIKYDSAGKQIWVHRYDGTKGGSHASR